MFKIFDDYLDLKCKPECPCVKPMVYGCHLSQESHKSIDIHALIAIFMLITVVGSVIGSDKNLFCPFKIQFCRNIEMI